MSNEINLNLRSEVLEMALIMEESVNKLMVSFLSIEKENLKAFSNKSGNLSFKNKIDLLWDVDLISSDQYQDLQLLMEYRNQFLHNIRCSSFTDAFVFLGDDKRKKLLKFDTVEFDADLDFRHLNAYRELFSRCLHIVVDVHERRYIDASTSRRALVNTIDYGNSIVKNDTATLLSIIEKCFPSASDSKELIIFKEELVSFISNQSDLLAEDLAKHGSLREFINVMMESKVFKKLLGK